MAFTPGGVSSTPTPGSPATAYLALKSTRFRRHNQEAGRHVQRRELLPQRRLEQEQSLQPGAGRHLHQYERQGRSRIVEPGAEYEKIRAEISAKILEFRDPDTGGPVIQGVYRREDIFKGPKTPDAADLQLSFYDGYRTSWQTALGAIPESIVVANLKKWSGDHCASDQSDTPGVLFSNRKIPDGCLLHHGYCAHRADSCSAACTLGSGWPPHPLEPGRNPAEDPVSSLRMQNRNL